MEPLYTFVDLTGNEQPHEVLERTFAIDLENEGTLVGLCCEALGGPMPEGMATGYFELWRIDNRKRRKRMLAVPLVFASAVPESRLRKHSVLDKDELLLRVTAPSVPCRAMIAVAIFIESPRGTR